MRPNKGFIVENESMKECKRVGTRMTFDTHYAHVTEEQREGLRHFRDRHPEQTVIANATQWTYLTAGNKGDVLLWLVGGLKMADAAWRSIPLLSDQFRVIAPNYPPLPTMSALADGLAGILDAEGVESAAVLAGSFGGMLAQVLVRRHPQRVSKLILSTTTPPDMNKVESYQQVLAMVEAAPEDMLREQAQAQMFGIIAPPEDEADFYRAYLQELYTERMGKDDITSTYQAVLDYMRQVFSPQDLADWHGQVLILDSDNDATFGEEQQREMLRLYPQAEHHTFHGAGHSPGSTQRELYFQKVREFLLTS